MSRLPLPAGAARRAAHWLVCAWSLYRQAFLRIALAVFPCVLLFLGMLQVGFARPSFFTLMFALLLLQLPIWYAAIFAWLPFSRDMSFYTERRTRFSPQGVALLALSEEQKIALRRLGKGLGIYFLATSGAGWLARFFLPPMMCNFLLVCAVIFFCAAFCFAPQLVMEQKYSAGKAVFFSFMTLWRNKGAVALAHVLGFAMLIPFFSFGAVMAAAFVLFAVLFLPGLYFCFLYILFRTFFPLPEAISEYA
ncbi:MAG: hypothetical protein LBG69_03445 [Zoogloeaceae bacterium]|jgi:uncharacterized membrane protein|nr:hypothetical protein [Zoogloeaceae bacterium]